MKWESYLWSFVVGFVLLACGGSNDDGVSDESDDAFAQEVAVLAFDQQVATIVNVEVAVVLEADSKAYGTLRFAIENSPQSGQLLGQLSGAMPTIRYRPTPDFSGEDTFTFSATDDDDNSDLATVSVRVFDSTDPNQDTDGDGLTDLEEVNHYKTNYLMVDTDGDSFSDWREAVDLAFDPASNNYRFNPLIADVPKMRLEFTSAPDVDLNYETTEGTSQTISTERSTASSTSVTSSSTESNATSVEKAHSVGVEITAGFEAGVTSSVSGEVSASYNYSHATTSETSHSFTQEQTAENSKALTQGKEFQEEFSLTSSSGSLGVSARVINDGALPFTVANFSLYAVEVDDAGEISNPIGNLNLDSSYLEFPRFTLAPGESSGDIIFASGDLDLDTTYGLLGNAEGLLIGVATSDILDAEGRPFAHNQSDLRAKNATVIIDYGVDRRPERYLVSTVGDPNKLSISAADIFKDVLRIDIVSDTDSLTGIRDVTTLKGDTTKFWMAIHLSSNGNTTQTTVYNIDGTNPNPSGTSVYKQLSEDALQDLELRAGDVLQFVVLDDQDGDGLGMRRETLLGTDPTTADSDGDGLTDKEEIDGWDVEVRDSRELRVNWVGHGKSPGWPANPNSGSAHRAFQGDIDEVRFWNVTRSQSQIIANKDQTVPAQSSLIAHWPMDSFTPGVGASPWPDTEGVQMDASGQGNDMSLRSISDNSTPLIIDDVNALGGKAFQLDGDNDMLSVPDRMITAHQSMTIEMRFRTTADGILFGNQNESGSAYTPVIYIGSDGKLRGQQWTGTSAHIMTHPTPVNDGQWHHVALTYNDTSQEHVLYLDGELPPTLTTGKIKHRGTTIYYHVDSDPLVADADMDSVNDSQEKSQGTDPWKFDTDEDLLVDDEDMTPTESHELNLASLTATAPTLAVPETTLTWKVPTLQGDVTDYRVAILEQQYNVGTESASDLVSVPGALIDLSLSDFLTCTDGTDCLQVVHYDSSSVGKGTYNMDRPVASDGNARAYIALVRLNGRWYRTGRTANAYLGSRVRVTIKYVSVENTFCYDHRDGAPGDGDRLCERSWHFLVDGQSVHHRPTNQWVRAGAPHLYTEDLNSPASTYSFDRPAAAGSCLNLDAGISEIDPNSTTGASYSHKICFDDGWGSGGAGSTVSQVAGTVIDPGIGAGNLGYNGTYSYQTEERYLKGALSTGYPNNPEIRVRANYDITVADLP